MCAGCLIVRLQWPLLNAAFIALQLRGIRTKCGSTPRDGCSRASHIRLFPPPVSLNLSCQRDQVVEEERLRQWYDGARQRQRDGVQSIHIVKQSEQGCVLWPTLFSPMLVAMLMDAYRKERPGIRIAYCIDG
ncbi:unnamed protein product [Schistocephalus solidus]|uniref:Reverse transcriptase domain-containing protein n=1 Tax=Schistocephalus solidus TaxID=70667 RepID=A0A183T335_SCHSO|nr:unnamed protein product [Schistocephalus solidus]